MYTQWWERCQEQDLLDPDFHISLLKPIKQDVILICCSQAFSNSATPEASLMLVVNWPWFVQTNIFFTFINVNRSSMYLGTTEAKINFFCGPRKASLKVRNTTQPIPSLSTKLLHCSSSIFSSHILHHYDLIHFLATSQLFWVFCELVVGLYCLQWNRTNPHNIKINFHLSQPSVQIPTFPSSPPSMYDSL